MNTATDSVQPRTIVVCMTGGTIAAVTDSNGVVNAGPASIGLTQMAAEVEASLGETTTITWKSVLNVDSSSMGPAQWDHIVDAVHAALDDPQVDGVVVTHGTDTLEETAMALDVFHHDDRPVVVTGAQRPADHPDTDGPANLLDAVLIASDKMSRSLGVLVVLGRAVLQARGVRKWHTSDLIGFARNAPDPHHSVDPDTLPDELQRPTLARRGRLAEVRVDVIAAAPGCDDVALRAVCAAGARALVLIGTGSGNLSPALAAGLLEVMAADPGLVVVITSRVPRGEVSALYGGTGGGAELARAGALFSGHLRASQSRVLVGCLLAAAYADHNPSYDGGAGAAHQVRQQWDKFAAVTA